MLAVARQGGRHRNDMIDVEFCSSLHPRECEGDARGVIIASTLDELRGFSNRSSFLDPIHPIHAMAVFVDNALLAGISQICVGKGTDVVELDGSVLTGRCLLDTGPDGDCVLDGLSRRDADNLETRRLGEVKRWIRIRRYHRRRIEIGLDWRGTLLA